MVALDLEVVDPVNTTNLLQGLDSDRALSGLKPLSNLKVLDPNPVIPIQREQRVPPGRSKRPTFDKRKLVNVVV